MQSTLRNIPSKLDKALRSKARAQPKSINKVAVEALEAAMWLRDKSAKQRDLSNIAGSCIEDPAFDEAIRAQDRIHPDDWK